MRALKSEGVVKFAYHRVLRRWQIARIKRGNAGLPRRRYQRLQHALLDLPAEYATAHQPGVKFQAVRITVMRHADHHADHAEVAELVLQPNLQRYARRIALELSDLRFGVAPRRKVELVRFVDQLDDPR